jgi:hypothetical protein
MESDCLAEACPMLRFATVVLLVVSGSLISAPIPKALKVKPAGSIVGTWRVTDSQTETWIFRSDGTAGYGNSSTKFDGAAVYTFDESVTPHEINWSQDGSKSWNLGVYVFEDGLLKINFSAPGRERMKNLTEQGGARQLSFRRLEE